MATIDILKSGLQQAFSEGESEVENSSLTNENQLEEAPQEEVVEEPQEEASEEQVEVPTDQADQLEVMSNQEEDSPQQEEEEKVDYESYVKENGYISKDEYEEKLQKLNEYESKRSEDPFLNAILERYEDGSLTFDWLANQTIDYDSIDESNTNAAKELIKRSMALNGLDEDEIEFEISDKYEDLFSGDYDKEDKEYQRALKRFEFDARKAKRTLKDAQEKNRLPESKQSAKIAEQQKAYEERVNSWKENWNKTIPSKVKDFSELKLNLNEGGEFKYELSAQDKKWVEKSLSNRIVEGLDTNFTAEYFDQKSNTWDVDKMIGDTLWKNSDIRGRFIEKILNESNAKKADEVVSTIKNTKAPSQASTESNNSDDSADKLGNFMLGRLRR